MPMFPGPAIAGMIEDNTAEFFLGLGRVNGSELYDGPEVKYVFAGSGYNRIMSARFPASGADAAVGEVVARLDARGIDALWFVNPSSPPGLSAVLERYGFARRSEWHSMALDLGTFSASGELPAGLEVREADDGRDLDAWARIVIASYDLDDDVHRGYGRHLIARGDEGFRRHHFLGLLSRKPVATAILFEGRDAAGIYWVGTLPEARGRGIATALTGYALREAKARGYRVAMLNASDAGQPLYRWLGFVDCYDTAIYQRSARP